MSLLAEADECMCHFSMHAIATYCVCLSMHIIAPFSYPVIQISALHLSACIQLADICRMAADPEAQSAQQRVCSRDPAVQGR